VKFSSDVRRDETLRRAGAGGRTEAAVRRSECAKPRYSLKRSKRERTCGSVMRASMECVEKETISLENGTRPSILLVVHCWVASVSEF
jgi:hypothetical protein